jgi:subtilase family serine protease
MAWHMPVLLSLLTLSAAAAAAVTSAALTAGNLVTIPVHNVADFKPLASSDNAAAMLLAAAAQAAAFPQGTKLKLVVVLKSRDQQGLNSRARAVMDLESRQYQRYLTPGQFGRAFGATAPAVSSVRSYLTSQGLTVQLQPNRLTLEVTGTPAQISRAFNTQLVQVQSQQLQASSSKQSAAAVAASGAKLLHAPSSHPKLPADVGQHVTTVLGLDNFQVVSPNSRVSRQANGGAGNRRRRSLLHSPGEAAQMQVQQSAA